MIKVMFVCLGNICRSPMAEFVLKDMVKKQGVEKEFYIKSSATSSEEIGNDIHYGTRDKLIQKGIPFTKRKADLTMGSVRALDIRVALKIQKFYMRVQWKMLRKKSKD